MPKLYFSLIFCLVIVSFFVSAVVRADEGGVSFWIPGQVGSFAATPQEPGLSLPITFYHTEASASKSRTFAFGPNVTAGLDSRASMFFLSPTYVFRDPLWGGQAAVGLSIAAGENDVSADGNASYLNNSLVGHRSDSDSGATDVYPMASVRWKDGVDNYSVYTMFNAPTGGYDKDRMANMGLGHWSLDAGGAYTYLDEKSGAEFSMTLGFTYNFKNTSTDYQNGVDTHIDIAGGQFLNPKFFVGLAGYYYYQMTPDSSSVADVGNFQSSVRIFFYG